MSGTDVAYARTRCPDLAYAATCLLRDVRVSGTERAYAGTKRAYAGTKRAYAGTSLRSSRRGRTLTSRS
eukprot:467655-Rhodomonas_salina.1